MDVETFIGKISKTLNLVEMKQLSLLFANNEISISDLFSLCLHQHQQIAFRASWILEYVTNTYEDSFTSLIPQFLIVYPQIQNGSVKRHFTKIMMMLQKNNKLTEDDFDKEMLDKCLTASFDWLLDPKTPLAVQCNALDIVYNFSNQENWILDELKVILEQKLVTHSPALISRSKKILKSIK